MSNEEMTDLMYWEKQSRSLNIRYHEETSLEGREELFLKMDYAESMAARLSGDDDEEEFYND